jgi:hypothetical protein
MNQDKESLSRYIPGHCNIGKEEVARRRNGAIFSGILSILLITVLLLTHTDKLWRLFVFLPLTSFFIGIQQWYNKFCMGFGMKGIFNFEELGKITKVEGEEMKNADKRKAQKMLVSSISLGVLITLIFYFIP